MDFQRIQSIEEEIAPKRVLVIYGPRRVGKTTLLQSYLATQTDKKIVSVVGDDFRIRELFSREVRDDILDFARPYDIVAIDEAQQVPSIGLGMKMLVDAFPEKRFILTGSSSFELSSHIGEPLTGRHFVMTLFPIAERELAGSRFDRKGALENLLIYGAYPEVLSTDDIVQKEKILNELVSSYLYRDVLALDKVRSPDSLRDIVRMLAFQVGSEVSVHEIATSVGVDTKTVGRYLDLLEKMFVIRKVSGFSRNLRNEMKKKAKYYFLDLGMRNAVIGQFAPFSSRGDIGALWENFVFMELVKGSLFSHRSDMMHFWRTHSGQEIDIVREREGMIEAFECKWSDERTRIPRLWKETYPEASITIVHKENYMDVLEEGGGEE
jgi:predicted AAA+ superfamily ATPase